MITIYKGFQIKPHKDLPMSYIVVTDGKGGKVPDILTGMDTTPVYAKGVIDKYLEGKPKKEADAKEVSKG